jgi:excinuclease UvrABC nuclease subunit
MSAARVARENAEQLLRVVGGDHRKEAVVSTIRAINELTNNNMNEILDGLKAEENRRIASLNMAANAKLNELQQEINELQRQNNMAEKTIASLKTDIKVRLFLRACFVLVVSVQAKLGGVKRKLECVVEELSPCLGGKEEHPL